MKKIACGSLFTWIIVTCIVGACVVFQPGLDLAHARDDYEGYWDYRLIFFLMYWIPISLPVWGLVTYALLKGKR